MAEPLTTEQQEEIIENYMKATGQTSRSSTAATDDNEVHLHKCGTPDILTFQRNYRDLDPALLSAYGVTAATERTERQYIYDSPGGRIKIHYDKTGPAAVWQANIDTDNDGTPNYIENLAVIADSAYAFIVDTLGFDPPLLDNNCVDGGGGDDRIDIYIENLDPGYYGLTYASDTACAVTTQTIPAYVVIDHDFQNLPGDDYKGKPINAARVTIAHELFHVFHFSLDGTEDIEWFEMSAVWMEEMQYDQVNDYYLLLHYFLDEPTASLNDRSIHMYASMLWPLYLSERHGRDIVRAIWNRTSVPNEPVYRFMAATDRILDSVYGENFDTEWCRFSSWTYFTGQYADLAPNGIGFSEKANYPVIPLDQFDIQRKYPFNITRSAKSLKPHHNSTTWIRLDGLDQLLEDYWKCSVAVPPGGTCTDSIFVQGDTSLDLFMGADSVDVDSGFIEWSLAVIYQMANDVDSHVVALYPEERLEPSTLLEFIVGSKIVSHKYRSITIGFSPTTINPFAYEEGKLIPLGYAVSADRSGIKEELVNVPSSVLTPYPNPAVVSELGGEGLNLRFQVETDETSFPAYSTAYVTIDFYTIAGDYLNSVVADFAQEDRVGEHRTGIYEATWNLKNQAGRQVASGAYLAYARLYSSSDQKELLAEDRVKVAVIK